MHVIEREQNIQKGYISKQTDKTFEKKYEKWFYDKSSPHTHKHFSEEQDDQPSNVNMLL